MVEHLPHTALLDRPVDLLGHSSHPSNSEDAAQNLGRFKFGYAGQYTDPETGIQYLRARYYDPGTGQMLTRDTLVATTRDAYGYGGRSPANASDPTGLECNSDSLLSPSDWGDCARDGLEVVKDDVVDDVKNLATAKGLVTSVLQYGIGGAAGGGVCDTLWETVVGVPLCAAAGYAAKRLVKASVSWLWDAIGIPNPNLIDTFQSSFDNLKSELEQLVGRLKKPFELSLAVAGRC